VPLAAPTEIQLAAELAAQVHVPALAVSEIVADPPGPLSLTDVGVNVKLQAAGAAACVTVYVCPPIVIVAVRATPVFAATVTVTVADPVPLPGANVAHVALLDAVHPHVVALAVNVTVTALAPADKLIPGESSAKLHGGGAAVWVTV